MAQKQRFELEITAPEEEPRRIPLGETTRIGRQVGNDVLLPEQRISRQHAIITCSATQCYITDLGSSNGTFIGDEQLSPNVSIPLKPETEVRIGHYTLTLHATPVEKPPPEERAGPEPSAEAMPDLTEEPPSQEVSAAGKEIPAEEEAPSEEAPALEKAQVSDEESEAAPLETPQQPTEEAAPKPPLAAERIAPPEPTPARKIASPPSPPAGGAPPVPPKEPIPEGLIPPGLGLHSERLLGYLPGIYHTDFMSRFLAIFESTLTPVEWNIDNFDLYLDPGTAPLSYVPWLANWFDLTFDTSWTEAQRRQLLREAHKIYARRGTRWALSRVLEIYTGHEPTIIDTDEDLEPFTFRVILSSDVDQTRRELIERLIDAHKPAHTMYTLEFGS